MEDCYENIGGPAGNVLLTEKQRERMKTYEISFIKKIPELLELPKKTLARMVVDCYSGATGEKTPLYDYMLETMIGEWYFPSVEVLQGLTKKGAVEIISRVCRVWLIEFIYHSHFARIFLPEDEYYLED